MHIHVKQNNSRSHSKEYQCNYSLTGQPAPQSAATARFLSEKLSGCFSFFFLLFFSDQDFFPPYKVPFWFIHFHLNTSQQRKLKNGGRKKWVRGWFPQYFLKPFSVNPADAYYNPDTSPYRSSYWVQLFRKSAILQMSLNLIGSKKKWRPKSIYQSISFWGEGLEMLISYYNKCQEIHAH